jgi:hypothetical protein
VARHNRHLVLHAGSVGQLLDAGEVRARHAAGDESVIPAEAEAVT